MAAADSTSTDQLITAAAAGDDGAVACLFDRHRPYLRGLVDVRLEPALRARVDASDIVQETLVVAHRKLDDFLQSRPVSFRVWLRHNAFERLIEARRRHLAHKRDARRDRSITDASSLLITRRLLHTGAEQALVRQELVRSVQEAIARLSGVDQEMILLRHAEGLTNAEAAEVLEIDAGAASKRYGRALRRLLQELSKVGFQSI